MADNFSTGEPRESFAPMMFIQATGVGMGSGHLNLTSEPPAGQTTPAVRRTSGRPVL